MLFAVPAAYALARLRYPAKRASGFYVLATQMLPPVGLIIPYYLALQKIGGLDTYSGLTVIYLTFSLPFAIWLMVSYFEDVPFEMEEAALLDRAGRLRTLWYVILPQVRGGIAVTAIFVFLNAWNEFMFAVVLGGNRVRPVTVAMFNFISVEQTQWSRLAAGAMLAMAPVILIGIFAQRHIVKGLTVGAVKGGRPAMSGKIDRRAACASKALVKRHGATTVLHGIDLAIEPGEFFVLLGPSGSGKTTTLRILAGLESVSGGRVLMDGDDVTNKEPGERDVAMVFQSYALYPHMTVAQNIGFPLKMVGTKPAEIARLVAEAAGQGQHRPPARAQARPAVGRPAAALCAGARHRAPAAPVPARRAAVEPRRQASPGDAARAACAAARRSAHHGVCDARPGRSDDAGRPHRGVHGRPHRPGRHAARGLRTAANDGRRGLRRHAADEPAAGHVGRQQP